VRCALLLDHLGELQATIRHYLGATERGDWQVRVDVDDRALLVLEEV
jgi:hypothetical protein